MRVCVGIQSLQPVTCSFSTQEFSDIFRRAFASRVFPPDVVEQMGQSVSNTTHTHERGGREREREGEGDWKRESIQCNAHPNLTDMLCS